jgi:hypothetical protein
VDDRTARRAATDLGFVTTGTLGVLERAARMALVDFDQTITRLRATSFWVRESVIEEIRRRLRSGPLQPRSNLQLRLTRVARAVFWGRVPEATRDTR